MPNYTEQELSVFKYLFNLQESGATNMMGATPYIKRNFNELSLDDCDSVLIKWMNDYEHIANLVK
jgi:hypothetical protein